jgi:two-component system OmpR family response regulator
MNPPVDTKKVEAKPIRVLLLDDHADNLLLRAAILRQHGYDAISSSSVEDADWQYVNESFAKLYEKKRMWFVGRNLFEEFPELRGQWEEIILTVANTRETYVDRSLRGIPHLPPKGDRWVWNVLVFPLKLHDDRNGVVLSARLIQKKT